MDLITRWERRHANGWMTTATYDAARGAWAANAFHPDEQPASWATQGLPDAEAAQQAADARVPEHGCACGGWLPR